VEIPSVEESVVVGSGFESVNVSVGSSVDGSLVSVQFPLGCTVAVAAAGSGIDVKVAASVPVTAFESVRVGTLESFVDVASGTVELSVEVGAVSLGNSVVVTSSPG